MTGNGSGGCSSSTMLPLPPTSFALRWRLLLHLRPTHQSGTNHHEYRSAAAGRYYRNTRYIMFILLVAMGGWFAYDGWVRYPRENEVINQLTREQNQAQN